jgi:hypothetical protein
MKIGLFYNTIGNNNGPGKVVSNLAKGLELNGVEVLHNQLGDYNGCLQAWGTPIAQMDARTLVGPNLCVLPNELPWLWSRFQNMVVPSLWVKEMYESFDCVKNGMTNLHVWAVGIDTGKFSPSEDKKKWDVLLYVKRREEEAKEIQEYLQRLGLSVVVLTYSKYNEEELIRFARESKCCVLLTKTESQGIAYQEILSIGVPCYVLDKKVWDDYAGWSFAATSVPYFDERCGIISNNMAEFQKFYDSIANYEPRNFVLNNLSISQMGRRYLQLLQPNNE